MAAVLVLDDDSDLLATLVDVFSGLCGKECVTARDLADLERQRDVVLACELAVLDINLGSGRPSGLDAYHWLVQHGYQGRTAFLTGHASSHPLVAEARKLGRVPVLQKPIAIDELMALIEK